MNTNSRIKLKVDNSEQFRDALAHSGVFDFMDCVMHIECPVDTSTEEIDSITRLLEGVINVVDVAVTTSSTTDQIKVDIQEVPIHIAEGKSKKDSK
jgi:hypothetical protein